MSQQSDEAMLYRIGTVSRLTGIATVTLRMWERRYGVVEPLRNAGQSRLYTREDIGRLALIKRLVDSGHPISTIATLKLEQLQERLQFQATSRSAERRVAILGDALPALLEHPDGEFEGLNIVLCQRNREGFLQQLEEAAPDVVVLEYATLHEDTVDEVMALLRRSGAERAVIVYGFGRRSAIRLLDRAKLVPLRAPVGIAELRRACMTPAASSVGVERRQLFAPATVPSSAEIPAQRYDHATLARYANLSTSIECECPQHLAEMLLSLMAFEQYSEECHNRNPADAALHGYLHFTTAQARALMEEALSQTLAAEGIDTVEAES